MLKYGFLAAALLFCLSARAQFRDYPDIPQTGAEASGFIPPGWKILHRCEGDMNRDGYPDIALVIQAPDSVPESFPARAYYPSLLLILFYEHHSGEYRLAASSQEFVTLRNAFPAYDTFNGMHCLANGDLRFGFDFVYSGGVYHRQTSLYTFRYRRGSFVLIREERMTIDHLMHGAAIREEIDYRTRTARRTVTTNRGGDRAKTLRQMARFRIGEPLTFDLLGKQHGRSPVTIRYPSSLIW